MRVFHNVAVTKRFGTLIAILLLVALLLPLHTAKADTTTVSVPAISPWSCDTGVDVSAGQALRITATGSWTSGVWTGDGDGDTGVPLPGGAHLMPGENAYSLVGKIGVGGTPFFVGAYYIGLANASGRIYLSMNDIPGIFGDNSGSLSVVIDVGTQSSTTSSITWSSKRPMLAPRRGAGSVTVGNKIYVVSGAVWYTDFSNNNEVYDTSTNIWTSLAPISLPRAYPAVVAYGNKLYVIGGSIGLGGSPTTSMEIYDIASNSWTAGTPMTQQRWVHGAAIVGDMIYVIGGNSGLSNPLDSMEIYDISSGSWTLGNSAKVRDQGRAVAINSDVYFLGDDGILQKYDTLSGNWTLERSWPNPNSIATGGLEVYQNKLYVIRPPDYNYPGNTPTDDAEIDIYDPATDSWSRVAHSDPWISPRDGFATGVVGNSLFILGGYDDGAAPSHVYKINEAGIILTAIGEEFTADSNTVALWHFNEGSGTVVSDASGHGHNGTIVGATWVTEGLGGCALNFGGGKYVSVPSAPDLDGMDEITVEMWVYPRSLTWSDYPGIGLINKWGPSGAEDDSWNVHYGTPVEYPNGRVSFVVSSNWANSIGSYSSLPLNEWSLVKVTYKRGESLRIYINGVLDNEIPALDLQVPATSQQVLIGMQWVDINGPHYFDGMIDEVRISNIARTTPEQTSNTPVGTNVTVPLSGAVVTFPTVTGNGTTSASSESPPCGSLPSGYFARGSTQHIISTATYTGPVTVGITYDPSGIANPQRLRLFHCDGSGWKDVTTWVDTTNHIVYGQDSTLSWWQIGDPVGGGGGGGASVPVFPSVYIGIGAAFGAAGVAYMLRRRSIVRR